MSSHHEPSGLNEADRPVPAQFRVTVRGVSGCVFRATDSESFCFVPEKHVRRGSLGDLAVDEVGYQAEGWAARNRRRSESEVTGNFLFPDAAGGMVDPALPEVAHFLGRFV